MTDHKETRLYALSMKTKILGVTGSFLAADRASRASLREYPNNRALLASKSYLDDHYHSHIIAKASSEVISSVYMKPFAQAILGRHDFIASIGPNCRNTYHVRRIFDIEKAGPLDWNISVAESVIRIFSDPDGFNINASDLVRHPKGRRVANRKWLFLRHHDFPRDVNGIIPMALDPGCSDIISLLNEKYKFLLDRFIFNLSKATRPLLICNDDVSIKGLIKRHSYAFRDACYHFTVKHGESNYRDVHKLIKNRYNKKLTTLLISNRARTAGVHDVNDDFICINATKWLGLADQTARSFSKPYTQYDLGVMIFSALV